MIGICSRLELIIGYKYNKNKQPSIKYLIF